jgi:hypothetical protein
LALAPRRRAADAAAAGPQMLRPRRGGPFGLRQSIPTGQDSARATNRNSSGPQSPSDPTNDIDDIDPDHDAVDGEPIAKPDVASQ